MTNFFVLLLLMSPVTSQKKPTLQHNTTNIKTHNMCIDRHKRNNQIQISKLIYLLHSTENSQ
jgi:hypothetical protein